MKKYIYLEFVCQKSALGIAHLVRGAINVDKIYLLTDIVVRSNGVQVTIFYAFDQLRLAVCTREEISTGSVSYFAKIN